MKTQINMLRLNARYNIYIYMDYELDGIDHLQDTDKYEIMACRHSYNRFKCCLLDDFL